MVGIKEASVSACTARSGTTVQKEGGRALLLPMLLPIDGVAIGDCERAARAWLLHGVEDARERVGSGELWDTQAAAPRQLTPAQPAQRRGKAARSGEDQRRDAHPTFAHPRERREGEREGERGRGRESEVQLERVSSTSSLLHVRETERCDQ